MVTVDTYWAKIFVGFKNTEDGTYDHLSLGVARELCSKYANEIGLCVTLTPTEYIYSNDSGSLPAAGYAGEMGAIVGLINYPRFPSKPVEIQEIAIDLATILKTEFEQRRVTVMFPDKTVMLGEIE